MNSKKICDKCNTELSTEMGKCFYCTSELNSEKQIHSNDSTNLIFAIIGLALYLLIYYRIFFEPLNGFVKNYTPILANYFSGIFIISAVIFPLILAAIIFAVLTFISNPNIIGDLIQLAFVLVAKIVAGTFLVLLGLAIIVFSIKFIKSQLFS